MAPAVSMPTAGRTSISAFPTARYATSVGTGRLGSLQQRSPMPAAVGTTATTIHKVLSKAGSDWGAVLPFCQLAINNKVQDRSGAVPFELMFNRPLQEFQDYRALPQGQHESVDAWVKHQIHVHSVLFPTLAQRLVQKKAAANERALEGKLLASPLAAGTVVMLFDPQHRDSKNHPPYVGPYEVAQLAAHGVYWWKDKTGRILERPVPVDQLKIMPRAARHEWLLPAPLPGSLPSEWHYVDRLLQHRDRKGQHEYLVLWKGHPASAATWEPAVNIDDSLIQDFMRKTKAVPRAQRDLTGKKHRKHGT